MTSVADPAFGVEGTWPVLRPHAIRWAECDANAHVNHAAYLTLCEDLRVAQWVALGGRFVPDQPAPVVAQLEARYLRPLVFLDDVLLGMRTVSLGRTSLVHEYAVWKRAAGLAFTARAVLVLVRGDSGARVPIPDDVRKVLETEVAGAAA